MLAVIITGIFCPLVFALNDDVMLRSILSGSYTGSPDGHAIYMKYPLTGVLSFLYGIIGSVPWLSIFFASVIGACLFVMVKIVADKLEQTPWHYAGPILAGEVFLVLILPYYFNMHYTVLAAMLAGTGLLCLFQYQWLGIVLLWIAFMVRDQIFFLTLPFLLVLLLWQISLKPGAFQEKVKNSIRLLAVLLGGILVFWGMNQFLYGSSAWKEYQAYNQARTDFYDYTGALPYETYQDVYEEIGITREEYELLLEYGLMLGEDITAEQLESLSQKSAEVSHQQISHRALLEKRVKEYIYRTTHGEDFPHNLIVIVLYLAVVGLCLWQRKWIGILWMAALGVGRSIIWLYLMVRGRYPERVTISLYLIEIFLLVALLLSLGMEEKIEGKKKKIGQLIFYSCCVLCLFPLWEQAVEGYERAKGQQQVQEQWQELQEYMGTRETNFYYLDVYSVVEVTGQVYETTEYENYMLLGGWITKSPLHLEKQQNTGFETALEGLCKGANIFLVAKETRDISWMAEYANSQGILGHWDMVEQIGQYMIYEWK